MSSKVRIHVKYPRANEEEAKKLLGLYCTKNIRIVSIDTVKSGFILLMDDIKEAEKIFEKDTLTAASLKEFNPVIPNEISCERTLFLKVNNFILTHSIDEIIQEIENQNEGIKIVAANKISNSSFLKVSVEDTNIADKILQQGIKMFKLYTPRSSIKKQRYTEIVQCFNCFKYNHHQTRFCMEPRVTRCTNCKGTNHTYKDCNVSINDITCHHCNQNHHTFAYSCPVRKKLVHELQKQPTGASSYANATRNSVILERRPSAMSSISTPKTPLLPTPPPRTSSTPLSTPLPTTYGPPPIHSIPFPPTMNVPPPPPPFPLHPATANLMISVMAKTTAAINLALHKESLEPDSFSQTYKILCQNNNLPILNLENYNLTGSNLAKHNQNSNPNSNQNSNPNSSNGSDLESTSSDTESSTSSLSNEGESTLMNIRATVLPSSSSPSPSSAPIQITTSSIATLPPPLIPYSPSSHTSHSGQDAANAASDQGGLTSSLDSDSSFMSANDGDDTPKNMRALSPASSILSTPKSTSSLALTTFSPISTSPSRTNSKTKKSEIPPESINPLLTTINSASPPTDTSSPLMASSPTRTNSKATLNVTSPPPTINSASPSTAIISPLMTSSASSQANTKLSGISPPPTTSNTDPLHPPTAPHPNTIASHPTEHDELKVTPEELQLYRVKNSRWNDASHLTTSHKNGKIAIKCNNKIIRNEEVAEIIINNKFQLLKETGITITDEEMKNILENNN